VAVAVLVEIVVAVLTAAQVLLLLDTLDPKLPMVEASLLLAGLRTIHLIHQERSFHE
jgi:hypothetical protein